MKYITIALLSVALIISAFMMDTATAETVTVPDTKLAAEIRGALDLAPNAPIPSEALGNLTVLSAWNAGISNLTGLEHATSLTRLHLSHNSISNLSPLSNLTN